MSEPKDTHREGIPCHPRAYEDDFLDYALLLTEKKRREKEAEQGIVSEPTEPSLAETIEKEFVVSQSELVLAWLRNREPGTKVHLRVTGIEPDISLPEPALVSLRRALELLHEGEAVAVLPARLLPDGLTGEDQE